MSLNVAAEGAGSTLTPLAWDTETSLIRPAVLAPELVCVTWQRRGLAARIAHHEEGEALLRSWLEDPTILFVGHNVAYDFAVVLERYPSLRKLVFQAYRDNRVTDTQIRQQLLDIASGTYRGQISAKGRKVAFDYTLEALAKRCAGMQLQKDGWRLSYSNFLATPLALWPAKAVEVQEAARPRVLELNDAIARAAAAKDKTREKALVAERDGLLEMIASDPSRASEYPLDDARATLAVFEAQEKHAAYLKDQFRQTRAAFALHLNSAWGLRTDAPGVAALRADVEAHLAEIDDELRQLGLVRADGSRDTKAAKRRMIEACAAEGVAVVRTDAHFERELTLADQAAAGVKPRCFDIDGRPLDDGHEDCAEHVGLDAEACERSEDDILRDYALRTTLGKQLSNDIPALERGVLYPVHTRYGLAATGRSTSSKPNIQNQSTRKGFREAFVARDGFLFAEADFPSLELYTLAQCCVTWLGESELAKALNGGLDPHLWFAAKMLRLTYDEALAGKKRPDVKRARQLAKAANFGFPGGMGIPKFIQATRKGMISRAETPADGVAEFRELGLDEETARKLKDQWFEAWPEMRLYFERVKSLGPPYPARFSASVETLFTHRVRGDATFCAACNNGFQALGSDCAKHAGFLIAEACYADASSPLFNSRPCAFVHDEFIAEVPDDEHAHDAAVEMARLMTVGANAFLPDVPIPMSKMEPLLMKRWSKKASSSFDASGRLVAWAA